MSKQLEDINIYCNTTEPTGLPAFPSKYCEKGILRNVKPTKRYCQKCGCKIPYKGKRKYPNHCLRCRPRIWKRKHPQTPTAQTNITTTVQELA